MGLLAGLRGSIMVDRPWPTTVGQPVARRFPVLPMTHDRDTLKALLHRADESVEKAGIVIDESNEDRSKALKALQRIIGRR